MERWTTEERKRHDLAKGDALPLVPKGQTPFRARSAVESHAWICATSPKYAAKDTMTAENEERESASRFGLQGMSAPLQEERTVFLAPHALMLPCFQEALKNKELHKHAWSAHPPRSSRAYFSPWIAAGGFNHHVLGQGSF